MEKLNKYSFLISDGTGFLLLKTMEGETFEEAKLYFVRQLNKYYSLVTDVNVIKSFIAKENENKFLCKETEWFYDALEQLESQIKETLEENEMNLQTVSNTFNVQVIKDLCNDVSKCSDKKMKTKLLETLLHFCKNTFDLSLPIPSLNQYRECVQFVEKELHVLVR